MELHHGLFLSMPQIVSALRCEAAGVRLVLAPHWVKDLRSFVYLSLVRWFALRDLSPTLIE